MNFNSAYRIFIVIGCFAIGCIASAAAATAAGSCINRITLLTGFYNVVRNNNRINASSSVHGYEPWNVRMTGSGWCSVSLASMCEASISTAMEQYLLVDFGAEVVVEAIGTAAADNGNYLTSYMIEYARSDSQYFTVSSEDGTLFNGNSACTQTEQVRQFSTPVIARYLRIVPMEWVGPMICFRMELYGCFVRECPEINNLSDNRTLLPNDGVYESSTYSAIVGTENDVREAWCAQAADTTPDVILTFTQPLYITYATTRGVSIYWLTEYSYFFVGSSGRSLYTDVDGTSVYGQTNNGMYTIQFWEPIDASVLELRIDDYHLTSACVGIKLYGCVSNEAIDHSIALSSITTTTAAATTITTNVDATITDQVIPSTTVNVTSEPTVSTSTAASCVIATSSIMSPTTNVDATITDLVISYTTVNATGESPVSTSTTSSHVIATSSIMSNGPVESTCATTQTVVATVMVTVTSTVHATVSQSTTVRITPSPTCTVTVTNTVSASPSTLTCSDQQATTTEDSGNSCNAVAICVPIAVGIALVVCIIVVVLIWRLRRNAIYNVAADNLQMAKVYNDIYGAKNLDLSKVDKRIYDYPAFIPEKYDESLASNSNVTENVVALKTTDSAEKSITDCKSTVMNMKNPLYVPTSGTQTVNEETLNTD